MHILEALFHWSIFSMEDKQNATGEKLRLSLTPIAAEKMIPKFCTAIDIALLRTNNVIISMAYSEGNDNTALIDRIVIDIEHAKSLNDALTKVLKDAKK